MSDSHDIISDVVADRAPSTTDPVLNLRTGKPFPAEIDGDPDPVVVLTELGEDYRDVVALYVQPAVAENVVNGDVVQFTLFSQIRTCKLIKQRTPIKPLICYWAIQGVPGKDDWAS